MREDRGQYQYPLAEASQFKAVPEAETWRRVWGGRKKISRTKFSNDFFKEIFSILTLKINFLMNFFLVIDRIFVCLLPVSTVN